MKIYNFFKNGEKVNINKYKHSRFSNIVYVIPAVSVMVGYIFENIMYYLIALITYLLFKLASISISNTNKTEHLMFTAILLDNEKKELYKIGIFPEVKNAIPTDVDFKNDKYDRYVKSLKQNEFRLQERIGDCFSNLSDIEFVKHIIKDKPTNENYIILKTNKIYQIKNNDSDHMEIICDVYNDISKNIFIKAPLTINKTYENFNEIEDFINENNINEDTSNTYYYEESYDNKFFNAEKKALLWVILKPLLIALFFIILINILI